MTDIELPSLTVNTDFNISGYDLVAPSNGNLHIHASHGVKIPLTKVGLYMDEVNKALTEIATKYSV